MTALDWSYLGQLSGQFPPFRPYLLTTFVAVVWVSWWLCGVNWGKLWPALAKGAWVPLFLLAGVAALVWRELEPGPCDVFGFPIPHGWWQTGMVALFAAAAFFCGWLQGCFDLRPQEINLEPPAHEDGHGHGHH